MIGRVVSTKLKNTATILVERVAKHPLYKKTFTRSKKYLVDDPIGVKEGDVVDIVKTRPISKMKHWRIVKVVGKSLEEITKEKLKAAAEQIVSEVMPATPEDGQGGPEEKEGDRVQGIGFSEEVSKKEKVSKVSKVKRKEKLAPRS